MNIFEPTRGCLYSIRGGNANNSQGYYWLYNYDQYDNNRIHGTPAFDDGNSALKWQLMPVGNNSVIIVNQANGFVATVTDTGDGGYGLCVTDNIDDNTPTITGILVDNKVALYVPAYDSYIVAPSGDGDNFWLRIQTVEDIRDAAIWSVEELAGEEIDVPVLPDTGTINTPEFDAQGNAPAFTLPSPARASYIPFCLVKDSTISPAQAVQSSPYYILQQYEQYYQAALVENNTDGEHTFVEDWQFGASESKSRSFTQKFGMELGFNMTENEIFLKENENANISGEMGFEEGNTSSFSATGSKQIRVQVPARSKVALYGISTSYKLFQISADTSVAMPVAEIDKAFRMANKFLTISCPISNS